MIEYFCAVGFCDLGKPYCCVTCPCRDHLCLRHLCTKHPDTCNNSRGEMT